AHARQLPECDVRPDPRDRDARSDRGEAPSLPGYSATPAGAVSTNAVRPTALPTQFLRFALVGCAGFVVDATVLTVAIELFGAGRYLGRVFSYLAAATVTWALNRNYTFREQRNERLLREWAKFLASNAIGGFVNYATYA